MGIRTPEVPVNPRVVVWARETLNLSVKDAAELIDVDVNVLKAWESGQERPSFAQLKKLASAYKRATAVFLLPAIPAEAPTPKDFRVLDEKTESRLKPSTFIEIRKAQKKRDYALELFRLAGQSPPVFDYKASNSDDPELLGKQWRARLGVVDQSNSAYWKTDYDALNFWKHAVEGLGVLVFQASLESLDELRGLAVYHRQLPMILLNTKDTPRGRIFSLLHEFCHLLLKRSGIGNMEPSYKKRDEFNALEVFCNAFAAACLLPKDLLMTEKEVIAIGQKAPVTDALLLKISNRYQVSWEVVLRRLLSTGRITQAFYSSARADLQKKYSKKKEGGFADYITKMVSYNGEPFIGLVLESFTAGNISVSEASDFLGIKANHFEKLQIQLQSKKRQA